MNNERIIIALDFDRLDDAKSVVDQMPEAHYFKVGLQAFLKFGDEIITYLKNRQKKLFLDLKFKDIPNTVFGAVKSAHKYAPEFLTIHLTGGADMIRRAAEAAKDVSGLTILGVTVLTSLSNRDLEETGINLTTEEAVLKYCQLGIDNGVNAFVCSPMEIEPIRKRFGNEVTLVTPGIRPQWAAKGDQKRVFTPRMAIEAGSDFLVIGRPITRAENPQAAYTRIQEEINW